jgi:hypothetical protein
MKILELNVFINQNGNVAITQEGQIVEITPDMIDLVIGYLRDMKEELEEIEEDDKEQE